MVRAKGPLSRVLDVVVSTSTLVLMSPILVVVACAIALESGGPILFRQPRIGQGGRPFTLYKFRTMLETGCQEISQDARRLTTLGSTLRATSLDEFPQLWNVLRGDMSLVGPRPLLLQYLSRYSPEQARRHEVLPGITGLAQVNGRNALSWDEKFALDVEYVDRCSVALDIRILLKTVLQVVGRRGISSPGQATMGEFLGRDAR